MVAHGDELKDIQEEARVLPSGLGPLFGRVIADIRQGRHREAYTMSLVGMVLTLLGLLGVASQRLVLAAILASITFLVFNTTLGSTDKALALDTVLHNRESLGTFGQLLDRAEELWVYGPTAVNILVHAADIRRHVLAKGGQVRVIVQDPDSPAKDAVRSQLDDSLDFDRTLENSLATLTRMGRWGDCQHRLLAFSPGFSVVIVNPSKPSGFLVLELHGFQDDNITDRMHVRISRMASLHWFDYWVDRFQAMWEASRVPDPTPQP